MKRFILYVMAVSIFFVGVGTLVEKTSAKFKSDEKALELIRKARIAIGGDAAIANVKSLRIVGTMTHNIKVDGVERAQTGETEIAMMLPDKFMHSMKIVNENGDGKAATEVHKQIDVVVVGDGKEARTVTVDGGVGDGAGSGKGEKRIIIQDGNGPEKVYTGAEADKIVAADAMAGATVDNVKKIIIKKADGTVQELTGAEADKVMAEHHAKLSTADSDHTMMLRHAEGEPHDGMRQNELLHLTLGLLLSAPQGMDVDYTFGGEGDLDGTAANIVVASFAGQNYKLFLDRTSNLPVGMTFSMLAMPKIMTFNKAVPAPAEGGQKDVIVFRAHDKAPGEMAETTVKFSDYRNVDGLLLPFKWTHVGAMSGSLDVTSIEVNPANIADKFKDQKVMVRVAKPQ